MKVSALNHALGNIDIYLLDQLLKGRFDGLNRILDAGCGEARNLHWFLQNDYSIFAIDRDPLAVQYAQTVCRSLQKNFIKGNISIGDLQSLPYPDTFFDAVLSTAVLHFADNKAHFVKMFAEISRVLKKDGLLFIRVATLMGMDYLPVALGNGKYELNGGIQWFLADESLILESIECNHLELLEPIKSVCVHHQRSMTTLALKKKVVTGNW